MLVPLAYAAENSGNSKSQKPVLSGNPAKDQIKDQGQQSNKNKIQLIRNATMKITYAGKTFLTDPMLSPKGAFEPFAGIASNPTAELPFSVEEILTDVESVIVSHLHTDHFDPAAIQAISKKMPIFCQSGDESQIEKEKFQHVVPIKTSQTWGEITITRVDGKHGKGEILPLMGKVSGFVFQAKGEPTIYWVGDSIWCEEVKNAIDMYKPDIIITHSGGATIPKYEPIIMDIEQTLATVKSAPKAVIVAIHMESLDHCTVTRNMLRQSADKEGIPVSQLKIPGNGSIITF
ncbi:MAG: MBL fold metallo-hydrolase [Candidatus Riflebacteria bacterium]|nr:MBL fold metallo-hydrolase [Candidatus Riflebacteria bacterium]